MAESLLVGAAVGAVFGELLKAVLEMKDKALMFKPTLEYLTTTLDLITPVIKEIERQNDELGRPKEELEYLTRRMEEGTKVVYKCLKISKLNLLARIRHQDQLAELVESLMRFFIINMQAQLSRDMKETLLKVRRIHSTVHKRSRSFLRTGSSSDSASEDVGLSQIEIHDSTAVQPTDDENSMETNSNTEEAIIDHPARLLPSGSGVVPVRVSELEHLESKSTHPTLDAAWTNSAEQAMEDITSLSQKVSQIEAKAENSKATNNSMSSKSYDQLLYTNEKTFLGIRLPKIKLVQRKKDGLKGQDTKDPFEPRKMHAFEGSLSNSDLEELLCASAEYLGKTSYGLSYKASLRDGTTLVVKRLTNVSVGEREFERQMEIVQKLSQHPNVMPLRDWYCCNDEKLLICDYMAAGNFSELLHGSTPLNWDSRMKISLGVAKGIAHIHSESEGLRYHGNISSSNVLVTADLQGLISDLAISRVVGARTFVYGKHCYHAPEVFKTEKVTLTPKSDVYSFGILLLEMLIGDSPLCKDLPSWVRSEAMDDCTYLMFDPAIRDNEYVWHLWRLADSCVGYNPESRPSMDEVVRKMKEITSESN